MPFGLLEAAVATFGLAGGWSLGSRLRQALADSEDIGGEASASSGGEGRKSNVLAAPWLSNADATTMTVMIVGEPGVGKSLFVSRISNVDGVGRETLPKTLAPTWQKTEMPVVPNGRVTFQLLDMPGSLPELSIPFYGHAHAIVLMFDVGSSSSFSRMKTFWHTAVKHHRETPGARHAPGSTIVLAHIIDERRERQVTRREASAWCASPGVNLPYFETHPLETSPKVLTHLATAVVLRTEDVVQQRQGDAVPASAAVPRRGPQGVRGAGGARVV